MIDPSLTQTIRQFCDGELAPDEAQRFEHKLSGDLELQRAVVFERTLRKHVARLAGEPIPSDHRASLETRIRTALTDADAPASIPLRAAQGGSRNGGAAQPTWRINYLAVAAVLALVAGAVIFGILSPPIDSIRSTNDNGSQQANLLSTIGELAATQHDVFSINEPSTDALIPLNDFDDMASELSKALKARVTPIDLSKLGYDFYGAGTCGDLPCGGPAARMLFFRRNPDGSHSALKVSLFLIPEEHVQKFLDLADQRRWIPNNEVNSDCTHKVLRLDYPNSGLVYFLVTCDPDILQPASKSVLRQLEQACR